MKERFLAVDVLRGMTIFFMILVNTPGSWTYVYAPLKHAEWHGCTPTDLVFPFFLFISGVSMAFSISRSNLNHSDLLKKIWKRTLIIFLLGLLLNWFPFYHRNFADLRIMGVLQRIALAYGIAGTLVVLLKKKGLIIASALILIGYNLLLYFTSSDPYSLEHNFTTVVDLAVLGENHLYGGFGIPFDPEGLLHSFPAAINVTLGFLIGNLIIKDSKASIKSLVIYGILAIVLAQIWNLFFPINKPIWTSSYVLYTVGLGTLLLALLIYIVDIKKWHKWGFTFRVFGLNPLVSYILSGLFIKILTRIPLGEGSVYGYFYPNIFQPVFGNYLGSFLFALFYVFFIWLFAYLLFRKGKVIKV